VETPPAGSLAELATPASQVLWAAADRRWTDWSESTDVPRFYGWRVMAYDLGTWALRDLARATTSIGVAVPGPYPSHR